MKTQTLTRTAGRGTARGMGCMVFTLMALICLIADPTGAEMGMKFQMRHGVTDPEKPCDKMSYLPGGSAQFFGPPRPEQASTDDGIRFIHTDPHLLDGHRPYHDVYRHANVADGGALMFNWAFDK